jgi:hypothetical protein
MRSAEFIQAYPLDISPEVIHAGEHSALIPEAQDLSYRFGRLLHAHMSGNESDSMTHPVEMSTYRLWARGLNDIEYDLLDGGDPGLHALNELNFHLMNKNMHGLWRPIIDGAWDSEGKRTHSLMAAERALAIDGFTYFAARQRLADREGAHIFFEDTSMGELHNTLTGMIQEFDAALVLMGVAKRHPGMTIVPAPLNFERTKKNVNVDFVVLDTYEKRSIGVQVKTKVRQADYDRADKKRVVFVDGTVDFDNVKAMRTRRRSSDEQTAPWAGLIAAKMVDGMKPDKDRQYKHGTRLNLFLKGLAREMVGDMRVDYQDAIGKVEERILAKL